MVRGKRAFEAHALQYSVRVLHYHWYNSCYTGNAFIQHCAQEEKNITYCDVNAHFQNGIAGNRIRYLQEGARNILLHAKSL